MPAQWNKQSNEKLDISRTKKIPGSIFTSSLERAYKEFNLEQDTIRDREKK